MNDPVVTMTAEYNRLLRIIAGEERPREGETWAITDPDSYFKGRAEGIGRCLDLLGVK